MWIAVFFTPCISMPCILSTTIFIDASCFVCSVKLILLGLLANLAGIIVTNKLYNDQKGCITLLHEFTCAYQGVLQLQYFDSVMKSSPTSTITPHGLIPARIPIIINSNRSVTNTILQTGSPEVHPMAMPVFSVLQDKIIFLTNIYLLITLSWCTILSKYCKLRLLL